MKRLTVIFCLLLCGCEGKTNWHGPEWRVPAKSEVTHVKPL
jgi:hypothetical protein